MQDYVGWNFFFVLQDPKKDDQRYSSALGMLIGSLHVVSGIDHDGRPNVEDSQLLLSGVQVCFSQLAISTMWFGIIHPSISD